MIIQSNEKNKSARKCKASEAAPTEPRVQGVAKAVDNGQESLLPPQIRISEDLELHEISPYRYVVRKIPPPGPVLEQEVSVVPTTIQITEELELHAITPSRFAVRKTPPPGRQLEEMSSHLQSAQTSPLESTETSHMQSTTTSAESEIQGVARRRQRRHFVRRVADVWN